MKKKKRLYTTLLCSILLLMTACNSSKTANSIKPNIVVTDDSKDVTNVSVSNAITKNDMHFECNDGCDPGTSYEVDMIAENNSCHIAEIVGSSALDVKPTHSEYDIVLSDEDYLRIQYLVNTNMTPDSDNITYNTTSTYIANALSVFIKDDITKANKWLYEYYDEWLSK